MNLPHPAVHIAQYPCSYWTSVFINLYYCRVCKISALFIYKQEDSINFYELHWYSVSCSCVLPDTGDARPSYEKVSDAINERLAGEWADELPQPFSRSKVMLFSLDGLPKGCSEHCRSFSLNWSLGDSSVEVLDSASGTVIQG